MIFDILVIKPDGQVEIFKKEAANKYDAFIPVAKKLGLPIPTHVSENIFASNGFGFMVKEAA